MLRLWLVHSLVKSLAPNKRLAAYAMPQENQKLLDKLLQYTIQVFPGRVKTANIESMSEVSFGILPAYLPGTDPLHSLLFNSLSSWEFQPAIYIIPTFLIHRDSRLYDCGVLWSLQVKIQKRSENVHHLIHMRVAAQGFVVRAVTLGNLLNLYLVFSCL